MNFVHALYEDAMLQLTFAFSSMRPGSLSSVSHLHGGWLDQQRLDGDHTRSLYLTDEHT